MRKAILVLTLTAMSTLLVSCGGAGARTSSAALQDWQTEFNIPQRALTHTGESRYFVLKPGYQLVLEDSRERVTVTVLDEKKEINGITARVVEERSEERGELIELARNFFALDAATGDVFYLGEDVDIYNDDGSVSHEGTWLAYVNGSQPGLYLPGAPQVGMRYYQELARGIAEDRAEVISTSDRVTTPAGVFENSLRTRESSPIDPGVFGEKVYAPGIGLVEDGGLKLVRYGYVR